MSVCIDSRYPTSVTTNVYITAASCINNYLAIAYQAAIAKAYLDLTS